MNRAERRRNARQEKPKTYVLTEDQINAMKVEAVNTAARRAFLMFMSVPVMVLSDKFGFDKQELEKFMNYSLIWYDSVQNNETRLMELVKIAENECGVRTVDWEENNDTTTSRSNR
jgi:hypothetical protein